MNEEKKWRYVDWLTLGGVVRVRVLAGIENDVVVVEEVRNLAGKKIDLRNYSAGERCGLYEEIRNNT